jgi:hypothetical protein
VNFVQEVSNPLNGKSRKQAVWSRRQLLIFGWFPFFHRKQITLNGARFRVIRRGKSRRHYLVIHGDEQTARQVLETFMETHDGVAFVIETNTRNVSINGGELDPNRMFSTEGAELNLKMLNPGWSYPQVEIALSVLDHHRDHLVNALLPPKKGLLVALHNNSEEYSVKDEVAISDSVSLRQPDNPHAFFLCTDPSDYAALSKSPYNVVLQQKKPQQDDGSLSRLAAREGVRYVNLEVQKGDANRQAEMLQWLDKNLA